MQETDRPVELFISYSHRDEELREELEAHLSLLERQGLVRPWHDRKIDAGTEWEKEIDHHLRTADIILLLVSPAFISSRYCWSVEMAAAIERHRRGEARIIPIILRPVDWKSSPIGSLQALPRDAKPVVEWPLRDRAFLEIATELRRAIAKLKATSQEIPQRQHTGTTGASSDPGKRSAPDAAHRCVREVLLPSTHSYLALAWPPSENRLALGSKDGTKVFDLRGDGHCAWQYPGGTHQLRWSPDGYYLAVSLAENLAVLDSANGRQRWKKLNANGSDLCTSWSPDGRLLAYCQHFQVHVCEASTGQEVSRLESDKIVQGIVWSPTGQGLAAGFSSGNLQLWLISGADAPSLRDLSLHDVRPLAWSPDGSRLAFQPRSEADKILTWNVDDNRPDLSLKLKNLSLNPFLYHSAVWSPSGKWIAAAAGYEIQIWDAATGNDLVILPRGTNGAIMAIASSSDGLQLASITSRGLFQIWDLSDLE